MVKKKLLELLNLEENDLSHPSSLANGDYSTNIALKKKIDPEKFIKNIPKNDIIEKVQIIKPGFINFYLKKSVFLEELQNILEHKDNYGKNSSQNKKILLEFGQPNTHKAPHIGHLFSYIYGESLARILEATGGQLTRINYQGDIGLHVAKCLYVVKLKSSRVEKLKSLDEKVQFLQECYQEGSRLYEESEPDQKQIDELNQRIYKKDSEIYELWKVTRDWSLKFYKLFEQKIDIKFGKYFFESETAQRGLEIVKQNIGDVFEESDGAIIFRGEKYGLHTRVFVTKHGVPTYEAKDIGLMALKKDLPFDLSIVATANEQNEYWKVLNKVGELLFPQLKGKFKHIGYGLINLMEGKMSSRSGHIVGAFDLVNKVADIIRKEYSTEGTLASEIAIASIKYSFLKSEAIKNKTFDVKTSIAREGDSGPYLLYTYARTRSILEKITDYELLITDFVEMNGEELNLLRTLYRFPEVVESAARLYSPHLIAIFIFNLAKDFNLFYQKHPILKSSDETKQFRLLLTKSIGQILTNGLYLLGIKTFEQRM